MKHIVVLFLILTLTEGYAQFENHIISNDVTNIFFAQGMDIDKDGDLDIVAASSTGKIVWYENFGENIFGSSKLIYNDESGSHTPNAAAIMDIDEDGQADLVVALEEGDPIIWYSPDNQGNIVQKGSIEVSPLSVEINELRQADLDQDGNMDLLAIDRSDRVIWYRNLSDNEFSSGEVSFDFFWGIQKTELTDVNQDGKQDLIMFNTWDDVVQWFEGRGDGTFTEHLPIVMDMGVEIYSIVVEDINSDGSKDILYADGLGNIMVIESNGDGTWLPPISIYQAEPFSFALIDIVDVNGDGLNDFMLDIDTEMYISFQIGLYSFSTPLYVSDIDQVYDHFYIEDLDQDGDVDILNYNNSLSSSLVIYENKLNSTYQIINGMVFMDLNENGIRDENEFGLDNQKVALGPKQGIVFTNQQGVFGYLVPIEQYGLSVLPKEDWFQTSSPEFYLIDLYSEAPENPYNFGLLPLRPFTKVCPFINNTPTRCNTISSTWLTYRNVGTRTASGQVILETNGKAEFLEANPPPDVEEENKWIWNFENLLPSQQNRISLKFQMPDETEIGAMIQNLARVDVLNEEGETIFTKTDEVESELLCSYDPNDKLARSNLLGQSEFAYISDTILYTVRFQNTGNDTAFNIRIEDVLDKKLDWTTFHPITASHDYRTELNRETGLATFYFNDILLPDSTTNEVESHGFVTFGIASLANVGDKTKVENTASIFFDFNPPIITNTAVLTLLQQVETDIEVLENGAFDSCFSESFFGFYDH
ncbi:MAG: FG-GAP-like repeat-containing protein [Chitinophagales bacterium]